jgi:integrase
MAHSRLKTKEVENAKLKPATDKTTGEAKLIGHMLSDGGNLFLKVAAKAGATRPADCTRSWVFKYTWAGVTKARGLGALKLVKNDKGRTMVEAREEAGRLRKLIDDAKREGGNEDPIEAETAAKAKAIETARAAETKAVPTFEAFAEDVIDAMELGKTKTGVPWKKRKQSSSSDQWRNSLRDHAYPYIGQMRLDEIDLKDVVRVLDPIWREKPETASRVRGRIETILNKAAAHEPPYRPKGISNPAAWVKGGDLQEKLGCTPRQAKKAWRTTLSREIGEGKSKEYVRAKERGNHVGMPYTDVPAFLRELRKLPFSVEARALETIILTACRSGEICLSEFTEFEHDNGHTLVIPGARMKRDMTHDVPLPDRVREIVREMAEHAKSIGGSKYVFALGPTFPVATYGPLRLLQKLCPGKEYTTHGFRATFRTWASKQRRFSYIAAELCLAHEKRDATQERYDRDDYLEERREIMDAWAAFCLAADAPDNVVPYRKPDAA